MSRRIDVELTSDRGDGSWTWRAAGAREPKGVVENDRLPSGARVGDVLRVDAEFDVDGITILAVMPPKEARRDAARLEVVGSGAAFEPVTQKLVGPSDRPRRDDRDRDRGPRGPRREGGPGGPGARPEARGDRRPSARPGAPGDAQREHRPRVEGETRGAHADRPRRDPSGPRSERPARAFAPELPARPKAKRLRPGRTHRNAVLAGLPDEHRPIAEQLLRGGIPAVRQAIAEQNALLKADGKSEINPAGVLALGEQLMPALRVAEWLDRAESAKADVAELDLRDLRSVVVAADDPTVARDETARALAAELKAALSERQDREHDEWLTEVTTSLDVGRSIRALRLSSRPPKAGVRFPAELAVRLAAATTETLTPDATSDRWVAVLDALAFSPVRNQVVPSGPPASPTPELMSTVQRLARQLPAIAAIFGVATPTGPAPRGNRPERPVRPPKPPRQDKPVPPPPPTGDVVDAAPAAEDAAPVAEAPVAEVDIVDAPVVEAPVAEAVAPAAEAVEPAAAEPEGDHANSDALKALGLDG